VEELWYFAYGSNLSGEQMALRTHREYASDRRRAARLPGYRLAFNMLADDGAIYANIMPAGESVLGVLYRCEESALKLLDLFESGYQRQQLMVVDEQGSEVSAVVYVALPETVIAAGRPCAAYLERIVSGARSHGLPGDYISMVMSLATDHALEN
jgi:gamma-glutamylcyclotransferase